MSLTGKLARDRLPPRDGHLAKKVSGPELKALLVGKLHEEAEELMRDQHRVEEYADVLEVLLALAQLNGITFEDIQQACIRKREQLGGFTQGNFFYKPDAQPKSVALEMSRIPMNIGSVSWDSFVTVTMYDKTRYRFELVALGSFGWDHLDDALERRYALTPEFIEEFGVKVDSKEDPGFPV